MILGPLPLIVLAAAPAGAQDGAAQPSPDEAAAVEHFESQVRPLLAEHCIECHSGEKPKGNLRLDTIQGLREGAAGEPVFVAGAPDESLMVEAVPHPGSWARTNGSAVNGGCHGSWPGDWVGK